MRLFEIRLREAISDLAGVERHLHIVDMLKPPRRVLPQTVLYEMVTGKRAFQGSTKIGTISSILRDEPKPAGALAAEPMPRDLEKIIVR